MFWLQKNLFCFSVLPEHCQVLERHLGWPVLADGDAGVGPGHVHVGLFVGRGEIKKSQLSFAHKVCIKKIMF